MVFARRWYSRAAALGIIGTGGIEMDFGIRAYEKRFIEGCVRVWNGIVDEGIAFPQENRLDEATGHAFFAGQSFTGMLIEGNEVRGLYILHPNNLGRCGHLGNASYAVAEGQRGKGIGERLVRHSVAKCRELGFRILQFNAVVASNAAALGLYEKIGFTRLGTIPGGFRMDDGTYADIIPHYIETGEDH